MKSIKKLRGIAGASIVIALLLLLVSTLACASLFYIISTAVKNAGQGRDREQALLLAQSMSQAVQKDVENKNSALAKYLAANLGKSGWPVYTAEGNAFGNKDITAATKTFTMTSDTKAATASNYDPLDVKVTLSIYEEQDGVKKILHITTMATVKGKAGNQAASVTSNYDYNSETETWSYTGGGAA